MALRSSWIRSAQEAVDHFFGDGERRAGAGPAGDKDESYGVGRLVDQRQAVRRRSVGARPALGDLDIAARENAAELVEDQRVDPFRRERIGGSRIMMGVA